MRRLRTWVIVALVALWAVPATAADWYVGSVQHAAVAQWAALTAYSIGDLRRQLAAPSAGNERVFRVTTAGTSGAAEPSWTLTKAGTTNDGTAVWTEVTGNSTYGWGAAHARFNNGVNWMAAGDTMYLANDSAETGSNTTTFALLGTSSAPQRFLSVDPASAPPTALSKGASVSGGNFHMGFAASVSYFYGITFIAGAGQAANDDIQIGTDVGSGSAYFYFDDCDLRLGSSATTPQITMGSSNISTRKVLWHNTRVQFNNAAQSINRVGGALVWRHTTGAITGATLPTTLFVFGANASEVPRIDIMGVDLSALGSGKTIFDASQNGSVIARVIDSKLGSSVALTSGTIPNKGDAFDLTVINTDSGDTHTAYQRSVYQGTITSETTVTRTDGASDGATTFSRKMVSVANVQFFDPLVGPWIQVWNSTVGSPITVSVPVITDGVTLTDLEAWLEVEALTTSGFPLGAFASDRVADPVFGIPANQTSDGSSTWNDGSLSSPVKQTLSVQVTPAEIGVIRARVVLAKASTTLYYDPKILTDSGLQYMSEAGVVNEAAAATPDPVEVSTPFLGVF